MTIKRFKALLIILVLVTVSCAFSDNAGSASSVLIVPDNYPTIDQAISHASAGDTIMVKAGVYYENVQINKTLTLEGDNSASIIVGSSSNSSAVITLNSNNVRVSGFTVESLSNSTVSNYAYGIIVNGDNCTITDNTITNTYNGIFSSTSKYMQITDNRITNSVKDGILIFGGSSDTISSNDITQNVVSGIAINGYSDIIIGNNLQNNYRGIGLGSSYSVLNNNQISSNQESGVWLAGSNNIVCANTLYENEYGLFVTSQLAAPRGNTIYGNNFESNNVNVFDNSTGLIDNWDNGSLQGGNYWSDYPQEHLNTTGTKTVSTQYVINANNTDNYPLTQPSKSPSEIPELPPIPATTQNGLIASWSFDNIEPGGVVPDLTSNNPAVLGGSSATGSYTPIQVSGKYGEALSFNGRYYALVQPSPSLEIPNDITIDVWINVQEIKNVSYNNIFVEALRTTAPLPLRTLGLSIDGDMPQNASSPPQGALRGFVMTQNGVLNEIDTTQSVPFDQWIHVVFTRSIATGMHIYVDGQEQSAIVSSGVANPLGEIQRHTETYIGHDSITEIDQLQISNTAEQMGQPIYVQWWLWLIIIFGAVGSLLIYFLKFSRAKETTDVKKSINV